MERIVKIRCPKCGKTNCQDTIKPDEIIVDIETYIKDHYWDTRQSQQNVEQHEIKCPDCGYTRHFETIVFE